MFWPLVVLTLVLVHLTELTHSRTLARLSLKAANLTDRS